MEFVVCKRIIILCAFQIVGILALFSKTALYTDSDPITLLNVTNFKHTIHNTSNAWIVEFYNSWCGHCVRFAPEWIKLATDVKDWKKVIGVAAIDCAVEENVPLCQQYVVTAFPTLKFFAAYSTEKDLGQKYDGKKDIESIRQGMVEFVSSSNPSPPPFWPDLQPIKYLDMNSLWRATHANVSHAAILVEAPGSYLGRELILDSLHLANNIHVFRATHPDPPLIDDFKGVPRPFLIVISRDGHLKTHIDTDGSRADYLQFLEDMAKSNLQSMAKNVGDIAAGQQLTSDVQRVSSGKTTSSENKTVVIQVLSNLDKVYLQDLENVLHYMFWREIPLQKNISGDKLMRLRSFLSLLVKYLPGRQQTRTLFNQLKMWLDAQRFLITGDQLKNKIEALQKSMSFELKMKDWMGCKGSLPYLRGYPCGLWVTFHTLTVSAFVNGQMAPKFDPLEVLVGIRGYVKNFFSCRTCVEHFSNMSAELESEVKAKEDSVLWLWQAHNKVNLRLKGDETEDVAHPKVQFPTHLLCPNCRATVDGSSQWDLTAVLEFLLSHYLPEGITTNSKEEDTDISNDAITFSDIPKTSLRTEDPERIWKRDVQYYKLDGDKQATGDQSSNYAKWLMSSVDISLCIVLYISSIMLLLICYLYILTRHKHLLRSLKRNLLSLIC